MFKKITGKLKNKDNKVLVNNVFMLSLLQGANFVLPLLTLPYLLRVLGPDKFGLISFAQAFVQYFLILTDYGFNLSATRQISIHRDDPVKMNEIINAVFFIKIVLTLISFLVLALVVSSFQKFRQDYLLYYLTFGMVIGQVLFPIWFFQGVEKMKYTTFLNILSKIIFTLAIFVFVRSSADFVQVNFLNSLGYIVSGVIGIYIMLKNFDYRFCIPDKEAIIFQLKDGWNVFVSTVLTSLYGATNTFLLGLMTSNTVVGYFSAAMRLIGAASSMTRPIQQAIYPYMSKKIHQSGSGGYAFLNKLITMNAILGAILTLSVIIFSKFGITLLFGHKYENSILVLQIMAPTLFTYLVNNAYCIQGFMNYNLSYLVSRIAFRGVIINFALAPILIYYYGHVGLASAMLLVELVMLSHNIWYYKKYIVSRFKNEKAALGGVET